METNEWLAVIFIILSGLFCLLAIIGFGISLILRKLENIEDKL